MVSKADISPSWSRVHMCRKWRTCKDDLDSPSVDGAHPSVGCVYRFFHNDLDLVDFVENAIDSVYRSTAQETVSCMKHKKQVRCACFVR